MIRDLVINKNNIDAFSKLIPPEYRADILGGRLAGFGYFNDSVVSGDDKIVGVIIVRRLGLWLEMEWIALADSYNSSIYSEQMISTLAFRLSTSPLNYVGIYMNIYPEETDTYDLLLESGFEFGKGTDGIYEFTIDMVDRKKLKGVERFAKNCKCLKEAGADMIAEVEERLRKDPRALPLSFPIRFDDYDENMSIVYMDETACGVVLSTVHDDHLLLEVMVSQSPSCTAALLGLLLLSFDNLFDKKMTISVPVIAEEADMIVKKMVPFAKQKDIDLAYYRL